MIDQFRPSQIELDMRAQLDDIRRKAGLDLAVPAFDDPQIEHRDGIEWHQAPVPPRWHRCKAQTRGWMNLFTYIERCACGAIRRDLGTWHDRNQTRKARK
ncbi:hypothetical protein [Rhodococcus erythropolis]|uniref:hypothetical protein n=1 Tax=Rhodococcus erythropolis TaxID=1833 RepID=UPI002227DEBF|nr:hypothetical protein [Rhodococcus erythropolis]MCW2300614.1 hypothetical protein [Rhodococcus erythropolis]